MLQLIEDFLEFLSGGPNLRAWSPLAPAFSVGMGLVLGLVILIGLFKFLTALVKRARAKASTVERVEAAAEMKDGALWIGIGLGSSIGLTLLGAILRLFA